jgi:hypothetical protein
VLSKLNLRCYEPGAFDGDLLGRHGYASGCCSAPVVMRPGGTAAAMQCLRSVAVGVRIPGHSSSPVIQVPPATPTRRPLCWVLLTFPAGALPRACSNVRWYAGPEYVRAARLWCSPALSQDGTRYRSVAGVLLPQVSISLAMSDVHRREQPRGAAHGSKLPLEFSPRLFQASQRGC